MNSTKGRILVLDDRADNRELFNVVLSAAGYEVTEATNGHDALDLVKQKLPDLIITDVVMPEMDGFEFLRELRADPRTASVRVILCTATYSEMEVGDLAKAFGVSQVLVKPTEPDKIMAAVHAALEQYEIAQLAQPDETVEREHLRAVNSKLLATIEKLERANEAEVQLQKELRESEKSTAESLELLETLESAAPVSFLFVDQDFRIVRANEMASLFMGRPLADLLGHRFEEIVPELWPTLEPAYREVRDTGRELLNQERTWYGPGDSERRVMLSSYYPVKLADGSTGVGAINLDITEKRNEEAFRQAVMDNMSEGLFVLDGEGLVSYVNAAASKMLGYEADELRGRDMHATIHYQRADGSTCDPEHCHLRLARLEGRPVRKTDDAFTRKDGKIVPVSLAASPLMDTEGGNGTIVVFHDTTEEQAEQTRAQRELNTLTWVGRIRDALDEDRMVLYGQPILPLHGGDHNQELLIRMLGHDGEITPPGSFLPVAEKYGLINEIDRWVLQQAMEVVAGGARSHANLSADSVGDRTLLAFIAQALKDAGADPTKLVIEITETALMRDLEIGEDFTKGLADLGCKLALDDFGTGFGTFIYLKRLPIDYLKIDMEFVRDLPSNEANQHLVKAIVSLAQGFGNETIAEGVEDEATLKLLKEYGVDYAQGFFIGRPAPMTAG